MTRTNSNAGRVIKLIASLFFLYGLINATLWSFFETERFFVLMTPEYSTWMAILFSLGPLVCFGISRTSKSDMGVLTWNGIAILFNLVDLATNIAAFYAWWNTILTGQAALTLNGELISVTDYFGYGMQLEEWMLILGQSVFTVACILVTWSEEAASYVVGYCLQLIYEMFPNAPDWIATDIINFAYGASGAFTAEQARDWWRNRQRQMRGNSLSSFNEAGQFPQNPFARRVSPMDLSSVTPQQPRRNRRTQERPVREMPTSRYEQLYGVGGDDDEIVYFQVDSPEGVVIPNPNRTSQQRSRRRRRPIWQGRSSRESGQRQSEYRTNSVPQYEQEEEDSPINIQQRYYETFGER